MSGSRAVPAPGGVHVSPVTSEYVGVMVLRLLRQAQDCNVVCRAGCPTRPADCCVYRVHRSGCAIGVQLKSTESVTAIRNLRFAKATGYAGLLLCLVDHTRIPPRVWVVPGEEITTPIIVIPDTPKRRSKWTEREVPSEALAQCLCNEFEQRTTYRTAEDLKAPESGTQRTEYEGLLRLRQQLPLSFTEPAIEHCAWDLELDGLRVQVKVAYFCSQANSFQVSLSGCKTTGKRRQYRIEDFDILLVQLPTHGALRACVPHMYAIPMDVLGARGLTGRDVHGSTISFRPHRAAALKHWTSQYVVDLRDPFSAVSDWVRLVT